MVSLPNNLGFQESVEMTIKSSRKPSTIGTSTATEFGIYDRPKSLDVSSVRHVVFPSDSVWFDDLNGTPYDQHVVKFVSPEGRVTFYMRTPFYKMTLFRCIERGDWVCLDDCMIYQDKDYIEEDVIDMQRGTWTRGGTNLFAVSPHPDDPACIKHPRMFKVGCRLFDAAHSLP